MAASQVRDTSYEWKAVTLLGLGFGLVGLDRWIIAPLFPFMMKDLHLSLSGSWKPGRYPGGVLGRFCRGHGRSLRQDRAQEGYHPSDLRVLHSFRFVGIGDRTGESYFDSSRHGVNGRLLLPDEFRRDK